MQSLTIQQLVDGLQKTLGLVRVTDTSVIGSGIAESDVMRPGLLLAGFEQGFRADVVQILGESEMAYLNSLDQTARSEALARLCAGTLPCIIVAGGEEAPADLVACCNGKGVPLFRADASADRAARYLVSTLEELLAPSETLHGTLVDVYGVGLLFTGKSGIGKSECGLDLVENGHRLVADDVVHVVRTPQGHVIGSGNAPVEHFMEIRGVGIIDVQAMFGVRAIRKRKRVEVEVRLAAWSDLEDYERLGFEDTMTEILGVEVPLVTLPLVTGKNITVVAEVIALNHLLKLRGIHSALEFDKRVRGNRSKGRWLGGMDRGDDE